MGHLYDLNGRKVLQRDPTINAQGHARQVARQAFNQQQATPDRNGNLNEPNRKPLSAASQKAQSRRLLLLVDSLQVKLQQHEAYTSTLENELQSKDRQLAQLQDKVVSLEQQLQHAHNAADTSSASQASEPSTPPQAATTADVEQDIQLPGPGLLTPQVSREVLLSTAVQQQEVDSCSEVDPSVDEVVDAELSSLTEPEEDSWAEEELQVGSSVEQPQITSTYTVLAELSLLSSSCSSCTLPDCYALIASANPAADYDVDDHDRHEDEVPLAAVASANTSSPAGGSEDSSTAPLPVPQLVVAAGGSDDSSTAPLPAPQLLLSPVKEPFTEPTSADAPAAACQPLVALEGQSGADAECIPAGVEVDLMRLVSEPEALITTATPCSQAIGVSSQDSTTSDTQDAVDKGSAASAATPAASPPAVTATDACNMLPVLMADGHSSSSSSNNSSSSSNSSSSGVSDRNVTVMSSSSQPTGHVESCIEQQLSGCVLANKAVIDAAAVPSTEGSKSSCSHLANSTLEQKLEKLRADWVVACSISSTSAVPPGGILRDTNCNSSNSCSSSSISCCSHHPPRAPGAKGTPSKLGTAHVLSRIYGPVNTSGSGQPAAARAAAANVFKSRCRTQTSADAAGAAGAAPPAHRSWTVKGCTSAAAAKNSPANARLDKTAPCSTDTAAAAAPAAVGKGPSCVSSLRRQGCSWDTTANNKTAGSTAAMGAYDATPNSNSFKDALPPLAPLSEAAQQGSARASAAAAAPATIASSSTRSCVAQAAAPGPAAVQWQLLRRQRRRWNKPTESAAAPTAACCDMSSGNAAIPAAANRVQSSVAMATADSGQGSPQNALSILKLQQQRRFTSRTSSSQAAAASAPGGSIAACSTAAGGSAASCRIHPVVAAPCSSTEASPVCCSHSRAVQNSGDVHKQARARVVQLLVQEEKAGHDYSSSTARAWVTGVIATEFAPAVVALAVRSVYTHGHSSLSLLPVDGPARASAAGAAQQYVVADPCVSSQRYQTSRSQRNVIKQRVYQLMKQQHAADARHTSGLCRSSVLAAVCEEFKPAIAVTVVKQVYQYGIAEHFPVLGSSRSSGAE